MNQQQQSAISRYAPDYLARATEMLARAGEDGWVLRIEERRVFTVDGETGNTVITSLHKGDIADVKLSGAGDVHKVTPRGNQTYAVAKILVAAVDKENMDDDD